ncbi:hypothetical protein FOA52_008664 [Chlamydomonas sp. UWO 241]|nr:hypothetical protein FOA52_008664 [Chlamydomonas sp. UWO 241]
MADLKAALMASREAGGGGAARGEVEEGGGEGGDAAGDAAAAAGVVTAAAAAAAGGAAAGATAPAGAAEKPAEGGGQVLREAVLRREMREVYEKLDKAGIEARAGQREVERQQKELRQAVIQSAEITVCTLSAAGGELVSGWPPGRAPRFDALVIDEAAQALEPATLIPMQLLRSGARIVLVGDPQQLPPTVLSAGGSAAALSQSLFERLQRAGCRVTMLQQQYRMHPAISAFPSQFFYSGRLMDGVSESDRAAPFHTHPLLAPLAVIDVAGGREARGGGGSVSNREEAQMAAAMYRSLRRVDPHFGGTVAVISPYKAQLSILQKAFDLRGEGEAARVEFVTVDGYQGREADVVIFSAVRAHACGAIGFLQDVRRLNVAITRARLSLWVVCSAATLAASGSAPWKELLRAASARGALFRPPPSVYSHANGPRMHELLKAGPGAQSALALAWGQLQAEAAGAAGAARAARAASGGGGGGGD